MSRPHYKFDWSGWDARLSNVSEPRKMSSASLDYLLGGKSVWYGSLPGVT